MTENIKVESALKIDDYIENNTDCILQKKEPYELNGKREELQVYRLPLELLCYNIRNGRFAAELLEKEATLKRHLNPEKPQDATIIQELLLLDKNQTEYLIKDIQRVGQLRPGVITYDGFIIDGNRRVAVLKNLYDGTGENKYNYLEVVILPTNVTQKDLWRIEAGIQLSIDLKVSYGPVNELLKIKEGRDAGLSNKEIALILGGDNTIQTVKLKLRRLKLIEDYLKYVDRPFRYSEAERRVEHFIDLQNIMETKAGKKTKDWENLSPEGQENFLHATYECIRDGVSHMQIRKLRKVIKYREARDNFIEKIVGKVSVEKEAEVGSAESLDDEEDLIEEIIKQPSMQEIAEEKPEEEIKKIEPETPVLDVKKKKEKAIETIDDSVDKVEAKEESKKPRQLVRRINNIIKTLSEIDIDRLKPLKKDLEEISGSIQKLMEKLKS